MGKLAETLVWERSRAGKSDLLMLVKIADGADDEGRNAWMEVPRLMKYCRASERAAQNTLCRLVDSGEIEIEYNDEGREIVLRGGRRFRPKWFIHVRCVCAWDEYQQEITESAEPADLRRGRPKRKPAAVAVSRSIENRRNRRGNPQDQVEKTAETGSAYKERSLNELVVELEQGSAPLPASRKDRERTPEDNLGVITKLAHEALALHELTPDVSERDIVDSVELRCSPDVYDIAHNRDVVYRAIAAAVYQRRLAGKPPVLAHSPGDAAFRMKELH